MSKNDQQELKAAVWRAAEIMRARGLHVLDYIEQLSLFMFLKMLDERPFPLDVHGCYSWRSWTARTGTDLTEFVSRRLFPYLERQPGIFGQVFGDASLKLDDPAALAAVVSILDGIDLSRYSFDALGSMYEFLLSKIAEAGAAGEYFTYRHIIDLMIRMIKPAFGETIYDPAAGTCGFLWRSLDYLAHENDGPFTQEQWEFLRTETFWGHELNRLTYRMGVLNMFLRGISCPNIERLDTLAPGPQVGRGYDVILSNPPYGGKTIRENIRSDFFEPSARTQLLFLQHIMMSLNPGGRAAMISDEGLFFQGGAFARVRARLLRDFNVLAVVSLPPGAFEPYTPVKTSFIVFQRDGQATDSVWFYGVRGDGSSLTRARRFNQGDLCSPGAVTPYPNDLPDLLRRWPGREETGRSWLVPISRIEGNGYDLTVRRYAPAELPGTGRSAEDLVSELLAVERALETEVAGLAALIARGTDRE